MKTIEIPEILQKMNGIFKSNGYEAYLVGGAVRDMILGKNASDWDLTTNATPEQVQSMFHKVIPTGIAHGTVTVHFMGKEIEVTTYRCEEGFTDGRHPDKVSYNATLEEDLSRRDFTINAIAASLSDGTIVDPFDGQKDIERKILRTVGKAYDRFMEDGLRPIRGIRFAAQLGFELEEETFAAMMNADVQEKIHSISMERFRDEVVKLLKSNEPSLGFHLMEKTGILKFFIPELAECRGCTQRDIRGFHEFDVLDHILYACDGAPKDNFTVRLAALFHDIGKMEARTVEKYEYPSASGQYVDIIHFHMHDKYSAQKAKPILTRLRFPNQLIEKVVHLIEQHMFFFETNWTDGAVRRFIVRVGKENLEDLFALRYADEYGGHRRPMDPECKEAKAIEILRQRTKEVESKNSALSLKEMAINGSDLMKAGIPAGKKIGLILNELFQMVLEKPELNTKEQLLRLAENFSKTSSL
ncbi:MAG: HD domain-containing protein [Treponema sp.]|nr:HD domain-containing protein [Candidatus Treponema equifaecale]